MGNTLDTVAIEMKLDGVSWTDVTSDVIITAGVSLGYGIGGQGPLDRLAGSGQMNFAMNNSDTNSGSLAGYYTPGHDNARTGFELNCPVRLRMNAGALYGEPTWGDGTYYGGDYYKFVGKITKITVMPGTHRRRQTMVECQDFVWEMSRHKMDLLTTAEAVRSDTLVASIIDNMTEAPEATSYATGQETFIHGGDDLKDEKSTALAAVQKATVSEFGYAYVKGDNATGGVFVFEDRHTRINTDADFTFSGSELQIAPLEMGFDLVFNVVKANTFPRETDGGTEILYTLQRPIEVAANGSETITCRYTDPTSRSSRIGAKDLQDLEGLNQITAASKERYMEDGITGWAAGGAGSSVAQSATQAFEGTKSLKLTSGTGGAVPSYAVAQYFDGFAQNDIVYAQAWVYLEEAWPASVGLYIGEVDSGESYLTHGAVEVTATVGSWVRLSGTYTVTNASTAKLYIFVGEDQSEDFSGGSVDCYIDDVYLIDDAQLNFEFSSTAGGGGDKNGDLYITGSFGANAGEPTFNNDSGSIGYVTIYTIDGTALRMYDPIEITKQDATSVASYGKRELTLQLPYQENHLVGNDFAEFVLSNYKNPQFVIPGAGVIGNEDKKLAAALSLEPGDRIAITDDIGGIDDEYFVQSVNFTLMPNNVVRASWSLIIATAGQSWLLGDAGFSELGDTTILGV
jgi:hypothetical protein